MRRRITTFVVVGVAIGLVVVVVTLVQKARAAQNLVYSINNFRELGQFAELHLAELANRPPLDSRLDLPGKSRFEPTPLDKLRELGLDPAVPAGTMANPPLAVERRLSWVVPLLPTLNQARQPTADYYARLDRKATWDADANRPVAVVPLKVLVIFANPLAAPVGDPAVTQIVGLGGVGVDTPAGPRSPQSGAFHYSEPTPFALFTDGLSETALFADVSTRLGPWLQGGPSTVRALDPAAGPVVGPGGQFGGNLPGGGLFGFADHSVRLLSDRIDPQVLANLVTIAGGGAGDPLPGGE